jgi:hypothetical protein
LTAITAYGFGNQTKALETTKKNFKPRYLAAADKVYNYIDQCSKNLPSNLKINLENYYKINSHLKP